MEWESYTINIIVGVVIIDADVSWSKTLKPIIVHIKSCYGSCMSVAIVEKNKN